MTDERPDPYMLIGLHKLAETQGCGLVPELHDLIARLPETAAPRSSARILPFTLFSGRRFRPLADECGRVIAFQPKAAGRG